MSAQHTQGRLVVQPITNTDLVDYFGPAILMVDGTRIAVAGHATEADARRLAACWNACETMTTEQIEAHGGLIAGLTVGVSAEVAQRLADARAIEANYEAARPAIEACAGVPEFLLLPGSMRKQIDDLAAACVLLEEVVAADDEALVGLRAMGVELTANDSPAISMTERIRSFLKGGA